MPDFFTGMILIFIAGVWTHALPVSGIETPGLSADTWGRVLDVACHLCCPPSPWFSSTPLSSPLSLETAWSTRLRRTTFSPPGQRGSRVETIVWRHALRNALLPITTATALYVGMILGGAIQVETVFSWPGMGLLIYDSVEQRDDPVLEGCFLLFALAVILN